LNRGRQSRGRELDNGGPLLSSTSGSTSRPRAGASPSATLYGRCEQSDRKHRRADLVPEPATPFSRPTWSRTSSGSSSPPSRPRWLPGPWSMPDIRTFPTRAGSSPPSSPAPTTRPTTAPSTSCMSITACARWSRRCATRRAAGARLPGLPRRPVDPGRGGAVVLPAGGLASEARRRGELSDRLNKRFRPRLLAPRRGGATAAGHQPALEGPDRGRRSVPPRSARPQVATAAHLKWAALGPRDFVRPASTSASGSSP
jgi:hypothetical protein